MNLHHVFLSTTLCLMLMVSTLYAAPSKSLRTDAMPTKFQKVFLMVLNLVMKTDSLGVRQIIADSMLDQRRTRRSTSVSSRTIRYLRVCVRLIRNLKHGRGNHNNGQLLPASCKNFYCDQFRMMRRRAPDYCYGESLFIGGM